MGNLFARFFTGLFSNCGDLRVLIIGLDAAGKSTILFRMAGRPSSHAIPTIGFNVETVEHKGAFGTLSFTAWDVGGQSKIRPIWRHYYQNTRCLVFVVE